MLLAPGVVSLINFFDEDEIEKIKTYVKQQDMFYGVTGGDGDVEQRQQVKKTGSDYRKSKVFFISRHLTHVCEPFVKYDAAIEYANKTYLNQPIGSNEKWEAYQYADYSEDYNGYYKKHVDSGGGGNARTRLLSASLQLTDPSNYSGGDLILYPYGEKGSSIYAPKEIGTITIFLSTIYHEVTPVMSGLRNSLVTWIH